jgi:hypothetical protein
MNKLINLATGQFMGWLAMGNSHWGWRWGWGLAYTHASTHVHVDEWMDRRCDV